MIDLGLQGKRAVVSGAGYISSRAGHGRFSAMKLAEAGARVACIDIHEGRAHAIVEEILLAGGQAFPIVADMTIREEAQRAIQESAQAMGGIDVCVDIIGKSSWDKVEDISVEDWAWTIENNLTQVFYLFQIVGTYMVRQASGGCIVAIASVDGMSSSTFHAPYGAAKAGVISLTKTFAEELGRHGIRVNAVAPGNVGTGNEDQLEGRFGIDPVNPLAPPRAHDIGNAVLFLCSELAARITGQTLVVDGGATIRGEWALVEDQLPAFRSRYGESS